MSDKTVFILPFSFDYGMRVTAFLLALNFIVAIGVHINFNDSIEGMTPALAMFFGCITILFTNTGKNSLSSMKRG